MFSKFSATCMAGLISIPALAGDIGEITSLPAASLPWEPTQEGVAFAALDGDRFSEPYMAMVKLPAGLSSPPHTKSATMFGVIISGTMTHIAMGADPSQALHLPQGSYYRIPAGLPHVSSCVSDTDCLTFLYQDGKFDFLPVE